VFQFEGDVGVRQRVGGHDAVDVGELGGVLTEVLPTGGHVVEQVLDFDRGALRTARRPHTLDVTALDDEFRPSGAAARSRGDRQSRDRADGVQRLPAKSECRQSAL